MGTKELLGWASEEVSSRSDLQVTGGEATGDGLSTSGSSELQDSAVSVRTGGDDTDVARVLDGGEDTGGEDNLLPGLANVDNVDTYGTE